MAGRRLEYSKGTSAKFWSVNQVGSRLELSWGRLGTDGQRIVKDFGSAAAAKTELQKLIASKAGKGYAEVRRPSTKASLKQGIAKKTATKQATTKKTNPEPSKASAKSLATPHSAVSSKRATARTRSGAMDPRVTRALGRWADLSPRRLREELELSETVLDGYAASGVPICALYGLDALARPALWRGNRALAAGDTSGWNDVVDYCWAVAAAVDKVGVRSDLSARNVASVLLIRMALEGASKQVEALAGQLEEHLDKNSADSEQLHLAHFALSMAEGLSLGYAAARGPKGPFRDLAKQALSKRLGNALDRSVDFQLDNTGLTEHEGIEFANFELMPVWWFALSRLRRDNHLETPRPDHPLFKTPFATLPEGFRVTQKDNPWLARIEQLSKAAKQKRRKR